MKMKHKYFILYNNQNSTVESVSKIDDTIKRLLGTSVIALIYDIEKNEVLINTDKGMKPVKVPFVE